MLVANNNNIKYKMETRKFIYVFVASLIIFLAAEADNDRLYTLSSLLFNIVGIFIDPIIPLCINVIISPVVLDTSAIINIFTLCIIVVPATYVYIFNKSSSISSRDFAIIFYALVFLAVSTLLGYETNYITAFVQFFIIMQFLIVSKINGEHQNRLLLFALLLSGVYIATTVFIQLMGNAATFLYGQRLTFDGSVRTLSIALGFPIFYLLSRYFLPTRKKYGVLVEIAFVIMIVIMSALLILTYSRGALIAVVLAVVYILLARKDALSLKRMFTYLLLFVATIVLISNIDIDTNLMFDNLEGGNGRTDIWGYYLDSMSDRGLLSYIIGLGPGESQRITAGSQYAGYYAHSAILDYFFSYGLMGFGFILYVMISGFVQACKHKNVFAQGLLVLTVLMFATSNLSSSIQMHIMLALVYSLSIVSHKEDSVPQNIRDS